MAILRRLVVAATTAALTTLGTPAHADSLSPVLPPAFALPTGDTYNVTPVCTATMGVTTNMDEVSYVVQGNATSHATNGAVPVATGISCWIVDTRTDRIYGPASMGMPGPNADVVAVITIPIDSSPRLCGRGNALFYDNHTAQRTTAGCWLPW